MKYLKTSLLLIIAPFLFLISCDEEREPVGPDGRTEIEIRALELINTHRGSLGLAPLEHSPIIFDEARLHSSNMASRQVPLGHDGCSERINRIQTQLTINFSGENVAFNGSATPAITAVDQWLASSGHRSNIENDRFTHCGLAAVPDNNGLYYFTHILVEGQ